MTEEVGDWSQGDQPNNYDQDYSIETEEEAYP